MNKNIDYSEEQAHTIALELIRQHAHSEQFRARQGAFAPSDISSAYRVQDAYVETLLNQRNTSVAGFKIALTTPAMRQMVGFHDSVFGKIFLDQVLQSGESIVASDYRRLIIEFEIAFRIFEDVPLRTTPWTGFEILKYAPNAYAALEIADDRSAQYDTLKAAILTLVSDNAWNQGLVLGSSFACNEYEALGEIQGMAFIDGKEVGRGMGRDVLGNPADALAWLANSLAANGKTLKAGSLVSTGSLVKSQFPVSNQSVSFKLQGYGAVQIEVR